jgi:uncharacterized protein
MDNHENPLNFFAVSSSFDRQEAGFSIYQTLCPPEEQELDMPVANEQITCAVHRLVERFHPERIILFGSQARGTADERSDVDLLVISRFAGKRRELLIEMDRTLRGIGIARDIVLLTPEEFERDRDIPGTVARPALREGKVLYDSFHTHDSVVVQPL